MKKIFNFLFEFLNLNYFQRFKLLYFLRNLISGFLSYLPFISLKTLCSIAGAYKFKDFPEIYLSLDNLIKKKNVKKLVEIGVGAHNLNFGEVYIIEDCAGSYFKGYNGDPNLSHKKNLISYFQKKIHSINSSYLLKKFEKNVLDISVITSVNEAVLIKKKINKNKFKKQKKAFSDLAKIDIRKDKSGNLNLRIN